MRHLIYSIKYSVAPINSSLLITALYSLVKITLIYNDPKYSVPPWHVRESNSTSCNIPEDDKLDTHTTQISSLVLSLVTFILQDARPKAITVWLWRHLRSEKWHPRGKQIYTITFVLPHHTPSQPRRQFIKNANSAVLFAVNAQLQDASVLKSSFVCNELTLSQ